MVEAWIAPIVGRWTLLLLLVAGCYAPPLAAPPTRGEVTFGEQAERFIRQAGVVRLEHLLHALGNGVFIGENRLLSVNHLIREQEAALHLDDQYTLAEVIDSGDPAELEGDWVLLQTHLARPVESCQFERTTDVHPGEDVLVVGYWRWNADKSDRAVAISGTILEVPEVFRPGAGRTVCVDLGPNPEKYSSLSGSAVLVRKPATAEWKLAGLLRGWLRSERGEIVSIFVPLPELK